jgi:thiamine pyrophosphokinase
MYLLSTEAITFVLKTGKHRIKAMAKYGQDGLGAGLGIHVGIIPLKEPSIISTKGLEWDIKDWETGFGGQMSTSNHVKEEWVTVETTKDVLFTIDLELPVGQVSD